MTRITSGATLAIFAVLIILFSSDQFFFYCVMGMILICLIEYFRMLRAGSIEGMPYFGTLLGLTFAGITYTQQREYYFSLFKGYTSFFALSLMLLLTIFFLATFRGDRLFERASYTLFGVFYIPMTLITLPYIRESSEGVTLLLTLVAANALGDVCAYYTGKRLGRRKLAPVVSPNKTVEGFLGGALGALLFSLGVGFFFQASFMFHYFVALGLAAGICGPMGDLTESGIKRAVGVKDSSSLIPGHGGLLDRIDSLIFSAPVFYLYLTQFS